MGLSDWLSLALICILGASSPGPSLVVILASTRRFGRNAGILASIGHGLGVFFYAFMAATALGFILRQYEKFFVLVQIAGAFLLIWMGVRLLTSAFSGKATSQGDNARALQNSFRDGLAIAILNPKIAAFFASLFSQFILPGQSHALHIAMAGLAGAIDMGIYIILVILASMKASLVFLEKHQRPMDILLAVLLLGLGLSLLVNQLMLMVLS